MSKRRAIPKQLTPTGVVNLSEVCRTLCGRQLEQWVGVAPGALSTETVRPLEIEVLGHWMSIITLTGTAMTLNLRLYYDRAVVEALMGPRHSSADDHERVSEWVKEHLSMCAGRLRCQIVQSGVEIGMSIPVVTRGFDDVLIGYPFRRYESCWTCGDERGSLVYLLEVMVRSPEVLAPLVGVALAADEPARVELL